MWADPLGTSDESEAYPDDEPIDEESLPNLSPRSRPSSASTTKSVEPVVLADAEAAGEGEGKEGEPESEAEAEAEEDEPEAEAVAEVGAGDAEGNPLAAVAAEADAAAIETEAPPTAFGGFKFDDPEAETSDKEGRPSVEDTVGLDSKPELNLTTAAVAALGSAVFTVRMRNYHVTDVMAASVAASIAKFGHGSAAETSIDLQVRPVPGPDKRVTTISSLYAEIAGLLPRSTMFCQSYVR